MDSSKEYTLRNFKEDGAQVVQFYEMGENGDYKTGTTLEEMLRVSIERLGDLNAKFPCRENSLALTKMQEALMWLNARTKDRVARGVEGTHQA